MTAFTCLLHVSIVSLAAAQVIANNITCQQAIAAYEANRVISVIAHEKHIVPIRVGIPVAQMATLVCLGRGTFKRSYWVQTVDSRRCVVSKYCQ